MDITTDRGDTGVAETVAEVIGITGVITEQDTVRDLEDVKVTEITMGRAGPGIMADTKREVIEVDDITVSITTPQATIKAGVEAMTVTTKRVNASLDIKTPTIEPALTTTTCSSTTRSTTRSSIDRTALVEISVVRQPKHCKCFVVLVHARNAADLVNQKLFSRINCIATPRCHFYHRIHNYPFFITL